MLTHFGPRSHSGASAVAIQVGGNQPEPAIGPLGDPVHARAVGGLFPLQSREPVVQFRQGELVRLAPRGYVGSSCIELAPQPGESARLS